MGVGCDGEVMNHRKHLDKRVCRAFGWLEDEDAIWVAGQIIQRLPPGAVHIEVSEAIDALREKK